MKLWFDCQWCTRAPRGRWGASPAVQMYTTIGVSASLCPPTSLQGTIKSRYSDFIVREVAADGAVVCLRRLWPHALAGPPGPAPASPSDAAAELGALLGPAGLSSVQSLLADAACAPLRVPAPEGKDARGRVHAALRALSGGRLASNFEAGEGGAGVIFIERAGGGGGGGKRQRDGGGGGWRGSFDPAAPAFTRFVLQKSNVDTASALRQLAGNLGVPVKRFGFAGAKDKRAVTTQHVTVFRCDPQRVARAAARDRRVAVGDFAMVARALHLGELRGNRFTVTVRDVRAGGAREPAEAAARAAMGAWAQRGFRFVSFFGLQRFGGTALGAEGGAPAPAAADSPAPALPPAMRTHLVGRALLRGEWAEALALVLSPRAGDPPGPAAALAEVVAGSCTIDAALPRLASPAFGVHRDVLAAALAQLRGGGGGGGGGGSLAQLSRGQALTVVLSLPLRQRALYLHAYQSFLWNTLASARVAGGGEGVVEGDFVLEGEGDEEEVGGAEEEEEEEEAEGVAEEGAGEEGGEVAAAAAEEGGPGGGQRPPRPAPLVATPVDVAAGRFTPSAVALPIPGAEVAFSSDPRWGLPALGALLRADGFPVPPGGGEDAAASVRAVFQPRDRRFHCAGGYRRLFGRAENVAWALLRYGEPTEDLADVCGGGGGGEVGAVEGGGGSGGALLALQLAFTLKKSTYATVALREVLHS